MYDAIVIGVGGMGSSTLYHLAKSGARALGLEQFGVPHTFGSSHGSTRIIRLAYCEGPEYVPLLKAAFRYWRELEEVSGKSILHITGGLDIGPERSRTVEGSKGSCIDHGIGFEELDASEVNGRFGGYSLPRSLRAIYQPDGGYLLSELAISAFAGAARDLGADMMTGIRVREWKRTRNGIVVSTSRGEFSARRLVVTAGAWIGGLCPGLRSLCQVERQVMLWTDPLQDEVFDPDRFPIFNMETPSGRYYGFPNHRGEGFKIGKYHHLEQAVASADQLDRECHAEDESILRDAIRKYFPLANGRTRKMAACMFTNTPDGDFILDRHSRERDVFIAAGFSGHGFKFCSVIGKIMAELCIGRASSWNLGSFRLTSARTRHWPGTKGISLGSSRFPHGGSESGL